jgi:hypothetical protein
MSVESSQSRAASDEASWYRLDAEDRIVGVGGAWDAFARENGGDALAGDVLVGTRVYDHVVGHFTRRFLKDFLARARAAGGATRQSYRCDSPQAKRLMEMSAEACEAGTLCVSHKVIDERPLPFPVPMEDVTRRGVTGVLRCSNCNRVRGRGDSEKDWREPELAPKSGGPMRVIHTVCADCRKGISARERWGLAPSAR